jgi:putative transposase
MKHAAVVPLITALVAARQTYGYHRITTILNRQLGSQGLVPCNHKRTYRTIKAHNLLLARTYCERPEYVHDGNVIVMRSNLRWCSDGFEFTRLGTAM